MSDDTSKLPSGWTTVSVAFLVDFVSSGSRDWAKYYSDSGAKFIRIGNLERTSINLDLSSVQCVNPPLNGEGTRTRLKSGDILVSITADLGLVGLVPPNLGEAYVNQHVAVVRPRAEILPSYLAWFLASRHHGGHQLLRLRRGATKVGLGLEDVKSVDVCLAPLKEQHRVVAAIEQHLSDIDVGVASLERALARIKHHRAAVLKAACEGRLVPTEAELARQEGREYEPGYVLLRRILDERRSRWEADQFAKMKAKGQVPRDDRWKAKYEDPKGPDTDEVEELPEGWAWSSLRQLSTRITSGSRDWSAFYGRGTGTFVLAQNVRPGRLDLSYKQAVDPPPSDGSIERSRIRREDILITIVGANTGDVCVVSVDLDDHFVCQSVALVRPVLSKTAAFVECYLRSERHGQAQFGRFMYGQGRPHLGFDQLESTRIALPPLAEQQRIVSEVDRLFSIADEVEQAVRFQLARAQRLRQSVLKHAFEGKLVPQDPNDEPASVLVERIRSNQSTTELKKPRRQFSRGRAPNTEMEP